MDTATTARESRPARARLTRQDSGADTAAVDQLLAEVPALGTDVRASLDWAVRAGKVLRGPGRGRSLDLWEVFASTAALDVGVARVLEPHVDALTILGQAPDGTDLTLVGAGPESTWGVFAAEGPGVRLEARSTEHGWLLDGTKPWCSLAAHLSHALVTAWTPSGRRLFAVALAADGVDPASGPWVSRGLQQVVSAPVRFSSAPAAPVGDVGWYLDRPGFAWGGIGVAAAWWGGAVGVARDLFEALCEREPDQVALAHLGAVDTVLAAARATLLEAAEIVDASEGSAAQGAPSVLARRVRGAVARASEEVLARSAHARGPGPLTADERHARRVADLAVYVRQHHAERDDAALGAALLAGGAPW